MNKYLFAFAVLLISPIGFADVVKKSSSGICHDLSSPFYEKTKRFTEFQNISACLDSGGRLPKGMASQHSKMDKAISEANEQQRPFSKIYDRDEWSHWDDTDNNGCNSRDDALIQQADGKLIYRGTSKCDVIAGTWYLPYSGKTYTGPSRKIDADHIIPLSFAHKNGGAMWSKKKKQMFANDLENILIVSARLNRQKSDSGPAEWMPPLQSYRCKYLSTFDGLMAKYQLSYPKKDYRVVSKMHNACSLPAPYKVNK